MEDCSQAAELKNKNKTMRIKTFILKNLTLGTCATAIIGLWCNSDSSRQKRFDFTIQWSILIQNNTVIVVEKPNFHIIPIQLQQRTK